LQVNTFTHESPKYISAVLFLGEIDGSQDGSGCKAEYQSEAHPAHWRRYVPQSSNLHRSSIIRMSTTQTHTSYNGQFSMCPLMLVPRRSSTSKLVKVLTGARPWIYISSSWHCPQWSQPHRTIKPEPHAGCMMLDWLYRRCYLSLVENDKYPCNYNLHFRQFWSTICHCIVGYVNPYNIIKIT